MMPGEMGEDDKSQIMEGLWDHFKEFDLILRKLESICEL